MIRMPAALKAAGLKTRMLLQVHDELIFEAPEAEADSAIEVVRETMEGAPLPAREISVPLVVDAQSGDTWAEVH